MHFWIDKRSQCAYTGRHRVPTSLSSGVGRSRGRVYGSAGVGVRKGMATPLHRFAPVDCPPRRLHRHQRNPAPPVGIHGRRVEAQGAQGAQGAQEAHVCMEPAAPTIASLAAARSVTPDTLLRTAALGLHQSPMVAPHLKFGMLVSFALATIFLAGAKYYFDKQLMREPSHGGGSEAGVVCAAVACVCGVGCALSLCRAKPAPLLSPERVSSTAQRMRMPPPSEPPSSDDISLTTLLQSTRTESSPEAPPPYHIAVLLPGRERDASPPAYSALS